MDNGRGLPKTINAPHRPQRQFGIMRCSPEDGYSFDGWYPSLESAKLAFDQWRESNPDQIIALVDDQTTVFPDAAIKPSTVKNAEDYTPAALLRENMELRKEVGRLNGGLKVIEGAMIKMLQENNFLKEGIKEASRQSQEIIDNHAARAHETILRLGTEGTA